MVEEVLTAFKGTGRQTLNQVSSQMAVGSADIEVEDITKAGTLTGRQQVGTWQGQSKMWDKFGNNSGDSEIQEAARVNTSAGIMSQIAQSRAHIASGAVGADGGFMDKEKYPDSMKGTASSEAYMKGLEYSARVQDNKAMAEGQIYGNKTPKEQIDMMNNFQRQFGLGMQTALEEAKMTKEFTHRDKNGAVQLNKDYKEGILEGLQEKYGGTAKIGEKALANGGYREMAEAFNEANAQTKLGKMKGIQKNLAKDDKAYEKSAEYGEESNIQKTLAKIKTQGGIGQAVDQDVMTAFAQAHSQMAGNKTFAERLGAEAVMSGSQAENIMKDASNKLVEGADVFGRAVDKFSNFQADMKMVQGLTSMQAFTNGNAIDPNDGTLNSTGFDAVAAGEGKKAGAMLGQEKLLNADNMAQIMENNALGRAALAAGMGLEQVQKFLKENNTGGLKDAIGRDTSGKAKEEYERTKQEYADDQLFQEALGSKGAAAQWLSSRAAGNLMGMHAIVDSEGNTMNLAMGANGVRMNKFDAGSSIVSGSSFTNDNSRNINNSTGYVDGVQTNLMSALSGMFGGAGTVMAGSVAAVSALAVGGKALKGIPAGTKPVEVYYDKTGTREIKKPAFVAPEGSETKTDEFTSRGKDGNYYKDIDKPLADQHYDWNERRVVTKEVPTNAWDKMKDGIRSLTNGSSASNSVANTLHKPDAAGDNGSTQNTEAKPSEDHPETPSNKTGESIPEDVAKGKTKLWVQDPSKSNLTPYKEGMTLPDGTKLVAAGHEGKPYDLNNPEQLKEYKRINPERYNGLPDKYKLEADRWKAPTPEPEVKPTVPEPDTTPKSNDSAVDGIKENGNQEPKTTTGDKHSDSSDATTSKYLKGSSNILRNSGKGFLAATAQRNLCRKSLNPCVLIRAVEVPKQSFAALARAAIREKFEKERLI
ncbi:hypothetical protein FACS1894103_5790 [Campylobacterota bacterium]|nr:hypothetical protein FACS1894103_5790 [Campylobacterota bacterium]